MVGLNILFAVFAILMISRYVAIARRRFQDGSRADAWIAVFNVLMAAAILLVAILIVALKALAGRPTLQ